MINPRDVFHQLQSHSASCRYLVAYSGGLDSHVLLHLLAQLPELNNKLRAVHINHGLQKEADSWVEHCQQICEKLSVPFKSYCVNASAEKGKSLEEIARSARYNALHSSLNEDEVLLTAHHQSDQVETLLLQLFRGAGVNGLASMPALRELTLGSKEILHLRPLLDIPLQSLMDYAAQFKLDFVEDPSNKNEDFDRNFLRNTIIPQLKKRWPGINKTISRSAMIQAQTKTILDDLAQHELSRCLNKNNMIDIPKLLTLSVLKQKLLIRYWMSKSGFKSPSDKKLEHLFADVINAREDAQPLLQWDNTEIRRYKNKLHIMSALEEHDNHAVFHWDGNTCLELPPLGITLQPSDIKEFTPINPNKKITVRFRQGGESVFIPKRGIHISLKNLFHEAAVPPWQRSRIPLIYLDKELIKVIGII